jgi:hypothetical protein
MAHPSFARSANENRIGGCFGRDHSAHHLISAVGHFSDIAILAHVRFAPKVAVSSSFHSRKPGTTSLLAESDNFHPENMGLELTAPSLIPRCTHRAHDPFQQIQNLKFSLQLFTRQLELRPASVR